MNQDGIFYPPGRMFLLETEVAASGAGDAQAFLRPALGELWQIAYAYGHQDAGVAKTIYWYAHDGVTDLLIYSASIDTDRCLLYGHTDTKGVITIPFPLWVSHNKYLSFTVTTPGDGKKALIKAIVYEVRFMGNFD